MKKALLVFSFFVSINGISQPVGLDKIKLGDWFQNQQYEEAISYLKALESADSTHPKVLENLGYAYYMMEEPKMAESYYLRLIGIDSNNLPANHYLMLIKGNENALEAIPFARRLSFARPGAASSWRNLANLFEKIDQLDSALYYYEKAFAISPQEVKNAIGLGNVLVAQKKYSQADSILAIGLQNDSLNISLLKLQILSSYESKQYQLAIGPGEKLMRLKEPALGPLTKLVISYYNLNQFQDCIRTCEYMKANGLSEESVYYYEAKSQAKLKNYVASNELLQVCLSIAISRTAELYYYELGENLETLKRFKESVAQYDTAYYLFKNPVMLYNSGRIWEFNLKNKDKSREYYRRYLRTAKPTNRDEQRAYQYAREALHRKKT